MGKRIIITLLISGGAILSGCSSSVAPSAPLRGAVLPHHLLVEEWIERFYTTLENPAITQVIVVSPNHFNYGYNAVRTTDVEFAAEGIAGAEIKDFNLEHGITVHEPFITRHFPGAKLTPLIIKKGTNGERLEKLATQIAALDPTHTLVLASIDFTHMDSEPVAMQNDRRTIRWLAHMSDDKTITLSELQALAISTTRTSGADSVAMDSPETLYVVARVMQLWGSTEFNLWDRTSSASLLTGLDPLENTSHILGIFK